MSIPYSFLDSTLVFTHPLAGSFVAHGQVGFGQMVINNTVDHTAHGVAADGTVMVSYEAGENGDIEITVQQTSIFHEFLLGWFNSVSTAAKAGDASFWAAAAILVNNPLSAHQLTGVSPMKKPSKTYAAQGGNLVWRLMAANVNEE